MTTTITASTLDQALADISDVPRVERDSGGSPVVIFSGAYEKPVNDLVAFLGRLQSIDSELAEAAREGLYWEDGGYSGHGTATLNALALDGVSQYEEKCDETFGPFDCPLPLGHEGDCDLGSE